MYQLVVKPSAEKDALDAVKWYNQKKEGLGNDFLLVLDAKMNAILDHPELYQIVHHKVRRALMKRFPFGVFYIIEKDVIVIIAIQHTSQIPIIS